MERFMEEEEALDTVLPVGRYKGRKLRDVPEGDLFYLFRDDPDLLQHGEVCNAIICARTAAHLRKQSRLNGSDTERPEGGEG